MEKLIILFPLSLFLFQLDFLDKANLALPLITILTLSIQYYFRKRYFHDFYYNLLNFILSFCYIILLQLLLSWFLGVPFGEGDVFPSFIAQYLVFVIFLIPIILSLQIRILVNSNYTYRQSIFYVMLPSFVIFFLNKED